MVVERHIVWPLVLRVQKFHSIVRNHTLLNYLAVLYTTQMPELYRLGYRLLTYAQST